jgi:hypothetical protein
MGTPHLRKWSMTETIESDVMKHKSDEPGTGWLACGAMGAFA